MYSKPLAPIQICLLPFQIATFPFFRLFVREKTKNAPKEEKSLSYEA